MPELPEIETIKGVIEPQIQGAYYREASPSIARRLSHARQQMNFVKPLRDKRYLLWNAEESF